MWDFKRLEAWIRARSLIVDIYRVTSGFPSSEQFGLTSQLRRAANSIGANIAEGCGRASGKERGRYLEVAIASAEELEHHLIVAGDVKLLPAEICSRLISEVDEIRRMIKSLRNLSLTQP